MTPSAARTVFTAQTHDFALSAKTCGRKASNFDALINSNGYEYDGKNDKNRGSFFVILQLFLPRSPKVRRRNKIFNWFDFCEIDSRLVYMMLFFPFLDRRTLPFGNEGCGIRVPQDTQAWLLP